METVTIGQRVRIRSEVLGEDRELIIKLPDTYGTTEQSYPVIFMLDADYTVFFANDVMSMAFLRWLNRIPEMIVVGVLNTDRDRDMIPVYLEERKSGGGSDKFLRFITEELSAFLGANYRATGYHLLYGASNAGLFTVYALLRRPDFFAAGVASSPMIGHCPEHMHRLAREAFRAHPDMRNKLFMVYGGGRLLRRRGPRPRVRRATPRGGPGGAKMGAEAASGRGPRALHQPLRRAKVRVPQEGLVTGSGSAEPQRPWRRPPP